MSVKIDLEEMSGQCSFVPLAVMGYCIGKTRLLQSVWQQIDIPIKTVEHQPLEKLQDVLVSILVGCHSLAQVNTKLRPELTLAQAWQRKQFAEQSSLSRLLDLLTDDHIKQLQASNTELLRQHSQLCTHNWQQAIILDIDPTSLITSKHAQGSRKGWVSGQRNQYCRHVIRFTLAGYHESLLSLIYPGNAHGYEYCKPALQQLFTLWPHLKQHAHQVIIRSDAEQGTDQNISYMLWLGCQLLLKGYSGKRTLSWVAQVQDEAWQTDPDKETRWITPAPRRLQLGRSLDSYLLRWVGAKQKMAYATLHSTLTLPPFQLWHLYDQRAATELEIRADKSGLQLHVRRKQSLTAQAAWVILTDIAHNLLAWLYPWMLADSAFSQFGPKRIVNELFNIPGHVFIENGRLRRVSLWGSHPYAPEMRFCLEKLLKTFDLY